MWLLGKKKQSVEQLVQPDVDLAVEKLDLIGDARSTWNWDDGDPDYLTEYGLGREHIPALIELTKQWADYEDLPEGDALYAPVHAWRALGQLRAVEAVAPLLAMQNSLDAVEDDWYLEEFHYVFGMIGPPAIPQLADYLADTNNSEYPRISTIDGFREIAKRNPDYRDRVVQLVTAQLIHHERNASTIHGFLIAALLDFDATESAEEIEKAYAAGIVDESICGDWGHVREDLGVEGLGLAPIRAKPWRYIFSPPGNSFHDPHWIDPDERTRQRKKAKKEKAKRKQQNKSRKRNRKAK